MPNNLKASWCIKTIGSKQDGQNRQWPHICLSGENLTYKLPYYLNISIYRSCVHKQNHVMSMTMSEQQTLPVVAEQY